MILCIAAVAIAFAIVSKNNVETSNETGLNVTPPPLRSESRIFRSLAGRWMKTLLKCRKLSFRKHSMKRIPTTMNCKNRRALICLCTQQSASNAGSTVVRNYPGYEDLDCIQATLLIYDGQVIGGRHLFHPARRLYARIRKRANGYADRRDNGGCIRGKDIKRRKRIMSVCRLDKWIANTCGLSRKDVKTLVRDGRVCCERRDGARCRAVDRPRNGCFAYRRRAL